MKYVLSLVLIGVLVVAFPGGFSEAASTQDNTLRIAMGSLTGETLDPHLGNNIRKMYLITMYDYLVGVDKDFNYSPDIGVAYKWEASPDSKTWTFWIRDGIKFHNGEDLTAEDVKFSLDRLAWKGATSVYAVKLTKWIDRIEAPSPNKVVIHLNKAQPFLFYYLSSEMFTEGCILPKDYIEKIGNEAFNKNPIGSGPYRLYKQDLGSSIKLEAVENHWRVGKPRFKYLEFQLVPEESVRVAKMNAGESDVMFPSSDTLKELKGAGFNTFFKGGMGVGGLFTGIGRKDCPLSDIRVRKALNFAINREEILSSLFNGHGNVHDSLCLLPGNYGYVKQKPYPYNPEEAKRLLADAGYPKGLKVDVYAYKREAVPEGQLMMEAIAGYWEEVGIKCRIIRGDYMGFRTPWVNDTLPNPASIGWFPRPMRRFNLSLMEWFWGSKGLAKASHAHDPVFDALIKSGYDCNDTESYTENEKKMKRHVYQQHISVPILRTGLFAATNEKIKDWDMGRSGFDFNLEYVFTQK